MRKNRSQQRRKDSLCKKFRRHHQFNNCNSNAMSTGNGLNRVNQPRKRFKQLIYATQKKAALERVVGQDSFEMLKNKVQDYIKDIVHQYADQHPHDLCFRQDLKEFMVQDFEEKINNCAMI